MKTYYCETCGEWFRAKAQIDIPHHHRGFEPNFMLCKPVGLKFGISEYVGVKPIYDRHHTLKKWRAMLINVETGYSETPSWGHEAGGWIHYTYESMKDLDDNFIEAPTETQLIDKLKTMAGVSPDDYFVYRKPSEAQDA